LMPSDAAFSRRVAAAFLAVVERLTAFFLRVAAAFWAGLLAVLLVVVLVVVAIGLVSARVAELTKDIRTNLVRGV